jgi:L-lactate dehydrogenase complex protein LldF
MAVKGNHTSFLEKQSIKMSTTGLKSRKLMNMVSGNTKNLVAKTFLKKSWGPHRDLPRFAGKSFNEQWKEKKDDD